MLGSLVTVKVLVAVVPEDVLFTVTVKTYVASVVEAGAVKEVDWPLADARFTVGPLVWDQENVRSPAAKLAVFVTSTFRSIATPGLVEMVAAEARRGVTDPGVGGVEPVPEPELAGGALPGVNGGQTGA